MKEFSRCHPVVNLIFFIAVLSFSVTLMHPVCLGVALFGSVLVLFATSGIKNTLRISVVAVFVAVATAIFNGLFNHAGMTILWYFPNGNALTAESLVFGAVSGIMLATVVIWFMSLNKIITSEKIIYLFGGVLPAISLIISMILRFVPEFIKNFKRINDARYAIGKGNENKIAKMKKTFSAFLSITLENAIKTSDSMKARCFGEVRRTSYTNYKFTKRDAILVVVILGFTCITLLGVLFGDTKATYFPQIALEKITPQTVIAYTGLCTTPLIFGIWEGLRWKRLK